MSQNKTIFGQMLVGSGAGLVFKEFVVKKPITGKPAEESSNKCAKVKCAESEKTFYERSTGDAYFNAFGAGRGF
jgi:hypothetical protein